MQNPGFRLETGVFYTIKISGVLAPEIFINGLLKVQIPLAGFDVF